MSDDAVARIRALAWSRLRSRGALLLCGALVGAAWASVPRPSSFDERTVAGMLGESIEGEVEPDEYVWEPSRGALVDLIRGRGVVFLGRRPEGSPRDVFRAVVNVTPGGRPLRVARITAITATPHGDECDLVASRDGAAFATRSAGRFQSIGMVRLGDAAVGRRVALPEPVDRVAMDLRGDQLVLAFGANGSSALSLSAGRTEAGIELPVVDESVVSRAEAEPVTLEAVAFEGVDPWPPEGFSHAVALGEGRDPAVVVREAGDAKVMVLDGRQLEFALQPGRDRPPTSTGFVSSGRVSRPDSRKVVAAFSPVIPPYRDDAGAFEPNGWISPMKLGLPTIAATQDGRLQIGGWNRSPWLRGEPGAAAQWSSDPSMGGSHAYCVTRAGHVAVAWSQGGTDPGTLLPATCVARANGAGYPRVAAWGQDVTLPDVAEVPTVRAMERSTLPALAPPSGVTWTPADAGLPTPAFLPAVHVARAQTLGADVTVYHVDLSRFDLAVIAGLDERKHRKGGQFATEIAAADRPRVRMAFALGVGKRRGTLGLRIDGSTGLPFDAEVTGLVVDAKGLSLGPGLASRVEGADDATELSATVLDGKLVRQARERGPRQTRADGCVRDGALLVAVSVFDSHEATATTLAQLGCREAVAFDRGTEHASFVMTDEAAAGPFEDSALVLLERPMVGSVFSADWSE